MDDSPVSFNVSLTGVFYPEMSPALTSAVNPRGTEAKFWDRMAARYAKRPVADEAAYQQTLERVRAHVNKTDSALELGCGTGSTALLLAASVGHLRATDYSRAMIEIASAKARQLELPNLEFAVSALEEPALGARQYDAVFAFNLLHLVPDTDKALSHVAALLRPGGRLLCKTPCVGELWGGLRLALPLLRVAGKAPFVNFFTGAELIERVERAGFQILEAGHYPFKTRRLFIAARKL